MRVAIVTESFLPQRNGVANTVRHMTRELTAAGHEVLLVAPGPGPERHAGVPVVRVRSVGLPGYEGFPIGLPDRVLGRSLDRFGPDLVHLASPFALGASGLRAARRLGVPVLTVGSDEFPSFYSRSSGHAAPMRVDSPGEVAAVMAAQWRLGLAAGVVVTNPIPEEDEIPAAEIGGIIDRALGDMQRLGIHGKEATPYLLGRIVEITGGASLTANIALVRHNARLGAAVARDYAEVTATGRQVVG